MTLILTRALWAVLLCVLLSVAGQSVTAQEATAEATEDVPPPPTSGALYTPMTFPVAVDPAIYTNPFDIEDIEVLGIFQSPSGRQLVIPGFWMQSYTDACDAPCEAEDLQRAGDPTWQVRFTPQEAGDWTYTLQVRDGINVLPLQEGQFEVAPSDERGFVRVGANRRYFQFESGESYFPIGHNLQWSFDEIGGLAAYRDWLKQLHDAGGNYARLYIDVPWFIGLEWTTPVGDYRTAQIQAARLDAILEAAAEYDIYLQVVLLWHQALAIYTSAPVNIPEAFPRPDMSADWDNNPYNILYGGPIGGPSVFFYNENARRLFEQRLRYIVARWGYSPNIFAWEIVDEIDRTANYDPAVSADWLGDIASYLKQIDQQRHLITAGSADFQPTVAGNPLLDFTTGQFYQRLPIEVVGDQTTLTVDVVRRNLEANPIPTLLTAYSLNPWYEPTSNDPQGVHVQNTLWASVMAGASGGAASDWPDTYIIPQGLQQYYLPLAAFAAGVDWPNLNLQPAEAGLVTDDLAAYQPVRIGNFNRQLGAPAQDVVPRTITPDGVFPDMSSQPAYLYGQIYNNHLSQAQIYNVTTPINSYLEIGVRRVSPQASARLNVTVDGQPGLDLSLSADSRNLAIRIPLAAGSHEIVLDNLGEDWMELEYLEIGGLLAPARVLSLRDREAGVALAWLQHRDYTWEAVAAGVERQAVLFRYQIDRMPAGRYQVEIWNPLTGLVIGEDIARVGDNGILNVELVPMDSQLALRIFRLPEATATPSPTDAPTEAPPTATATDTPTEAPPTATETDTATPTEATTSTATAPATDTDTPTNAPTSTATEDETDTPTSPPLIVETNTPHAPRD